MIKTIEEMMSIEEELRRRILILDGAMGTKIQSLGLSADYYHCGRFVDWPISLSGNNDVLSLTAPGVIAAIHRKYIAAGADIICTNTFSANRISQHEYGCEEVCREMAFEGARIARRVADEYSDSFSSSLTSRKVWVAGSMGPTSKSLTLPSDMADPTLRATEFDAMAAAYREQAEALLDGGADMLLVETCFDALNAKAALYAIGKINEERGSEIPVMVSVTVNDRSGRTLTGQTLEAFFVSICHYSRLVSFGLNCSFGVTELRQFMEQLSPRIPMPLSIYPNAGLPNEMGQYDEMPEYTARHIRQMAESGLLNIAGGCCGTDERHIRAISEALRGMAPRRWPAGDHRLWLSGLEPLPCDREVRIFTNIGERTNVAGSRKFARLIASGAYDEALDVARNQIEGGASIIDVNMDDAMLDSRREMRNFCRHIAADPSVAKAVLMIDSSDWDTLLAGLKNSQGKCVVNSISLKNGETDFLAKARELRLLGAAVVVMAFDEAGQATTYARKTEIAARAYRLLTGIGFPPEDIIFDVNILSIGTGISDHSRYAVDFIRAVAWIKHNLPGAKTSGGVSNLSFSFRGNNRVREAMHSAFLYHAIKAGLDMAIVNPSMLQVYDDIEPQLLRAVEDVILDSDADATNRLTALATTIKTDDTCGKTTEAGCVNSRQGSMEERLSYALTSGSSNNLEADIPEALQKYGSAIKVIEGPLMQSMEHVGRLFGEGKMFLPQVVRSAKVMKEAVALLQPFIDSEQATHADSRPRVVLATANGDVHDIGKNIVGIVLACNGFEVVDLGVMVPAETILDVTLDKKPCLVGISGLITPSLKEMEALCRLFQRAGLHVPLLVGGATTSAVHTAVRLAPLYDGGVVYGGDASQTALIAKRIESDAEATLTAIRHEQQLLADSYNGHHTPLTSYEEACRRAPHHAWQPVAMVCPDPLPQTNVPISAVEKYIDWRMFLLFWGFKGETLQQMLVNPEARRTLNEGCHWMRQAVAGQTLSLQAVFEMRQAVRRGNDIVTTCGSVLPMLRSQCSTGHFLCMADFFDDEHPSPLGLFTIVCRPKEEPADDAGRLMSHAVCARLAEACAQWLQHEVAGDTHALRAAFGYASCPDHSLKRIVFDLLRAEQRLGISLTDRYSIQPSTSVCGMMIFHPEACYFPVGRIDDCQLEDYCRRRGISTDEGEQLLSKYIQRQ